MKLPTTPIYRDYPIPIWESRPELVIFWLQNGIILFVIFFIMYLPRLLSWIDEKCQSTERR